jgi:muramoyltetrapeptide carboxypeptidase
MAIVPPYLSKGDVIGIVCPAGFMPYEKAETCISVLKEWGYEVRTGKTLGNQFNYYSGTDGERLNDLQTMLDDPSIKAILCARGGYGTGRIIDQINFKKFVRNPKWIIGFSDVTVLHSHIYRQFDIASLHAPMAAAFNDDEYKNPYVQSLQQALSGVKANYSVAGHVYNKPGRARGRLFGGNLSLLNHLIGTPSDVSTAGKILFIEDVGEYIYNVDRMLYQLKRSGKLSKLAGLIIGGFTDMKDTTTPFGKNVYEVINDIVKEYDYPVCFQFPVSHNKENYALKIGLKYRLEVSQEEVNLRER